MIPESFYMVALIILVVILIAFGCIMVVCVYYLEKNGMLENIKARLGLN